MKKDTRGPWYLLTGLILGIAFGVFYSWVISPIKYVDTMPKSLRPDFKEQYRALIAAAYTATGDLERARVRLELLEDEDMILAVSLQAQAAIAAGRSEAEVRALSLLSVALKEETPPVPTPAAAGTITPSPSPTQVPSSTYTPTQDAVPEPTKASTNSTTSPSAKTATITPRASYTPTASFTPLPTRTPTATPGAAFVLQEKALLCEFNLSQPLVQVYAADAAGNPVPGIEFVIAWETNEEHFFTGLKPEMGLGYADFAMTPGTAYVLRMADGTDLANLNPTECEGSDGSRSWGIWRLTFVQP